MHAQENMLTSTSAHAHIQTADINIKITNQRVGFYEKFPPPQYFLETNLLRKKEHILKYKFTIIVVALKNLSGLSTLCSDIFKVIETLILCI